LHADTYPSRRDVIAMIDVIAEIAEIVPTEAPHADGLVPLSSIAAIDPVAKRATSMHILLVEATATASVRIGTHLDATVGGQIAIGSGTAIVARAEDVGRRKMELAVVETEGIAI
jgi:hypothetical protein